MSNEFDIISTNDFFRAAPARSGHRRDHRELQQRTPVGMPETVGSANVKMLRAELRKRFAKKSMFDVVDVMRLFKRLAGAGPTVAAALAPIVQEYVRETAHDVGNFDDSFGGI